MTIVRKEFAGFVAEVWRLCGGDDGTAERVRAIDAMLQRYLKAGVPGAVVLVTVEWE